MLPLVTSANHYPFTTLLRQREICKQEPIRNEVSRRRGEWLEQNGVSFLLFGFSSLTPTLCAFIIAAPKKYALHVGVQSIQPIIAGTQ
jgi:hypothetical protein